MRARSQIVFLNGRFLPAGKARVSALDRGLLYGDGLFETVRIYEGRPFALQAHLARLGIAAGRIHLPVPRGLAWWRRTIAELLRRNGRDRGDGAVRITITRGDGGDGLLPPRRPRPTVLLIVRSIPAELARWQRRGVRVVLLPFHPGLDGYLAGLKTTDYLTALLGKQIARRKKAFEGIYQMRSGELLEGTTSNLFIVDRGRLCTPPLRRGILPGVTRDLVLRLARANGIKTRERSIYAHELERAEEAFLTASTVEILPISHADGHPLLRRRGPITQRLQALFQTARHA